MMMLNIISENSHNFLIRLSSIDTSVPPKPPIEKGRTTEDCERRSICHLLSTLTKYEALQYPIKVIKRERPDFCLYMGKRADRG